jgi:hypothetical protein
MRLQRSFSTASAMNGHFRLSEFTGRIHRIWERRMEQIEVQYLAASGFGQLPAAAWSWLQDRKSWAIIDR